MNLRSYTRCLLLLMAGFLAGCSDAEENSAGQTAAAGGSKYSPLLVYVPDDTPYVIANSERLPDDLMNLMWKMSQPVLVAMQESIKQGLADAADNAGNADPTAEQKLQAAVFSEFDGKMNRQGLAELGIDPSGNLALYGIGVLPVLRAEIADSAVLDATIKRIEKAAGMPFPRSTMGEVEYFDVGDDEAAMIVSIAGNQLLLAVLPQAVKTALLPQVLGIEKPARNIAESGKLAALNSEFGLTPYSTMLIDLPRLVDAVLSDESESAMVLFADQRAKLSQACQREYREMAAVAPRLVSGYTGISATRIEQSMVLELRADIAEGLNSITVSMPGLGKEERALAYQALGLDILKAKQFLQGRIDALRQSPYTCENLASINSELELAEQRLNQPLPPFVGNFRGYRFKLSTLDLESSEVPKASGLLMVAMTNPELMLGMGQAFLPQLAQLQISMGGQPVAMPADLIPADIESPYLAMTEAGIGLSVGAGEEAGLAEFLAADGPDGPVFASMGYSGEAMALYQRKLLSMVTDANGDLGAAIDATSVYSDTLEQLSLKVLFTQKGVEINTVMQLKP